MRLIRSILFFIAVNSAFASQSQKAGSFDTTAFKKDIKRYFTKLNLPGLSVCVVHKGKIVYRQVEGYADLSKKTPITANSIFPIASVTKGFTAVLMMKYVEEGKISLDDQLLKYPFFRLGYSPASISPDVQLKHFLSQTSQSGPGSDFVYNGSRFNFIYGVFEKVSGQQTVPKAYFQELQRNILSPLHLTSTLPGYPGNSKDSICSRIVTPYDYNTGKGLIIDSGFYKNHDAYPGSALVSSIDDLVRYNNALDNNELISPESYQKMTTPYVNSKGLAMPYALGWFSEQVAGLQFHWGYGFGDSHAALLIRVPEKNLSFILLSNGGLPTGAVRMGSGHLLQSAFAISFVKHFVLASQTAKYKIDFNADSATLRQAFLKFHPGKLDPIYYDQLVAEALYDRFIETEMWGIANRAKQLVQLLNEIKPHFFSNYYPSLIYLLSDLRDEDLKIPTEKAISAYRLSGYFHPEVIQNIINYYTKTNQEAKAVEYYHMLADSKGFEEKADVIQACAFLGRFYLKNNNAAKGREYLWRCILLAKQAGYKNPFIEERVAEMNKN